MTGVFSPPSMHCLCRRGPILMNIDAIYKLIAPDMEQVNACIQTRLRSEVVLINQIGTYIINSGGKRLRPVIHLLATRAFGYQGSLLC